MPSWSALIENAALDQRSTLISWRLFVRHRLDEGKNIEGSWCVMAGSEMRGTNSGEAKEPGLPRDVEARALDQSAPEEADRPGRRFRGSGATAAERNRMLREVRAIEFPLVLRGYDRSAVDRYVEQVNRLIAELEISSSPEAAVRHALDEVGEETRSLLQRAHQTADDITARSRERADRRLEEAEQEAQQMREKAQQETEEARASAQRDAQELRETVQRETAELRAAAAAEVSDLRETAARELEQDRAAAKRDADQTRTSARREAGEQLEAAEAQLAELSRTAETIWRERRRLIEDVKAVGEQLVGIGEVEAKRFPRSDIDAIFAGNLRERAPSVSEPAAGARDAAQA
jgi:DivIVA domain-containing protein